MNFQEWELFSGSPGISVLLINETLEIYLMSLKMSPKNLNNSPPFSSGRFPAIAVSCFKVCANKLVSALGGGLLMRLQYTYTRSERKN